MTWVTRWDGYVDGWPVGWRDGIVDAPVVEVTATDRLQRLTSIRELRYPLMEHFKTGGTTGTPAVFGASLFSDGSVLAGDIAWLYPLQEDALARSGGDATGAPAAPLLTFADTTGQQHFGTFGVLPEGSMLTLETADGVPALPTAAVALRCLLPWTLFGAFSVSAGTPTHAGGKVQLIRLGYDSSFSVLATSVTVWVTETTLVAEWRGYEWGVGVSTRTLTDTVSLCDGLAHFVTVSSDGTTMSLQVDGRTPVTGAAPTITVGVRFDTITLGNNNVDDLSVSLAWIGAAQEVLDATELATLVLGQSERSDVRIGRYLDWVGIPTGDRSIETGVADVGHIPTNGASALDLAAQVNAVERGVLFCSGSRIVFHSRDHRDTETPVMTVEWEDLDASTAVTVDTATLVNDYTVSRPGGSMYRAVNQSSVLAYGRRTSSATIPAASDADLRSAADALVQELGIPQPRCPRLTFDLLTLDDDTVGFLLRLEVGDFFNVLMPPGSPGGDLALFVEGLEDAVSVDPPEWTLTVSTSPGGHARRSRIGPSCLFGTARFS